MSAAAEFYQLSLFIIVVLVAAACFGWWLGGES
jgi:hypothetical protein